jgi:hypothetical protein
MKEYLVKNDKYWDVIRGSPLEKEILRFFQTSYDKQLEGTDFFPGPQPISIERVHFDTLRKSDYVVCEKTDGIRHSLVCTMFQDHKVCCLINRALSIKVASVKVPKDAYNGTILDGELIDSDFFVYDAITVNGEVVSHLSLLDRLEASQKVIDGTMKLAKDPFIIKSKKFYDIRNFNDFCNEVVTSIQHKTDGFIFTPVQTPIMIGTHNTMFKWKPLEKNTIDFQFKNIKQGRWTMYIQEKGRLIYETELPSHYDPPEWLKHDMIVECAFLRDQGWWVPIMPRPDKKYPNNRRTYYGTLRNISENIQWQEFQNLF